MNVRKTPLRVIGVNEAPEPRVLTLAEAIETGSYLEILLAQRREMVTALGDLSGPALPAMHNRISAASKEIAALQSRDSDEAEGGANVEDGEFDAEAI